jgi:hypothetical protein
MNVREGMRRLALVAGVLGAGAGAIASYVRAQPLLAQRAQYKAFQTLVSSAVVQRELELLKDTLTQPKSRFGGVPVKTDTWAEAVDAYRAGCSPYGWKVNKQGVRTIHFSECADEKLDSRLAGNVSASDISGVETDDGKEVYRTNLPGLWSYLLIPIFPVLGFFLPWGAIKTLTWVGLGFSRSEKPENPRAEE